MRLVADTFAFCRDEVPRWNTISISGYHIREAGSDAVQEVAFTLADGIAYVEAARAAGLGGRRRSRRGCRSSSTRTRTCSRRSPSSARRAGCGRASCATASARKDPRSQMLRFHAQTAGSTLTAQQPLNNVVRTTIEALAAVLGGAQSLHTNGYDEALALPTEASARVALRTQQILAYESGVADVVDPLGGAYAVEALTDGDRGARDGAASPRSTRWAAWSPRSRRASRSARSSGAPSSTSAPSRAARASSSA